jgi:hypothetical protein
MSGPSFIFGYGSLISEDSRARTGDSGASYPCRLSGFKRGWAYVPSHRKNTSVACWSDSTATVNGIITEIPATELAAFDLREHGYKRVAVSVEQLHFIGEKLADMPDQLRQRGASVYIYVVIDKVPFENETPLAQTYIDVILDGCLEISEDFAIEFVTTTEGWNKPYWFDDRLTLRYVRPLNYDNLPVGRIEKIDSILHEHVSHHVKRRLVESVSLESIQSR